jgi:hypothetical protein
MEKKITYSGDLRITRGRLGVVLSAEGVAPPDVEGPSTVHIGC